MASVYDFDVTKLQAGRKRGNLPNLAKDKNLAEQIRLLVMSRWSNIDQSREELNDILETADKMMRCKPLATKYESRAETAISTFAVAVHQLKAMTVKALYDHLQDYRFVATGTPDDREKPLRELASRAMTELLHMAFKQPGTKTAISKAAHQFWKDGNCIVGVPWVEKNYDLSTWSGNGFEPCREYFGPGLRAINLKNAWLDTDTEDLDEQAAIFLKEDVGWTELMTNPDFVLPPAEERNLDKMSRYLVDKESQYADARIRAQEEAGIDGDATYASTTRYTKWTIWINLPVKYGPKRKGGRWDQDAPTYRHKVVILGDPNDPHILLAEPNAFPLGVPLLAAHESEDDIGFYHQPRSQRVESYYKQCQITQNQLIDNREKNNRRSLIFDVLNIPEMQDYDFDAQESIPCTGSPSDLVKELDIKDLTATNLTQLEWLQNQIKETLHATNPVMGIAAGGRESASSYLGNKAAATTPIYEAIARFEDAIIVGYMSKFAAYVQTAMKPELLVELLGNAGMDISQYASDILSRRYDIVAEGVKNFTTEAERTQQLLQIYQITGQDSLTNRGELLREIYASRRLDPNRFVNAESRLQAFKAALIENQIMLQAGRYDEVDAGDDDDVHIIVHERGIFEAEQNNGSKQNIALLKRHLADQKEQKQNVLGAGIQQPNSVSFGPPGAIESPTPGQDFGRQISGGLGNVQGGSQVPPTAA